jgi:hypothetical protein
MVNREDAGRREIGCDELLSRHGDYVDGLLAPLDVARLRLHLRVCASCARYDRIVQRGLELARELPVLEPSTDFEERLQHRLYHVQDAERLGESRAAGAATTFAVASMLALLAWSPLLVSRTDGLDATASSEPSRPVAEPPATYVPLATPLLGGLGGLGSSGSSGGGWAPLIGAAAASLDHGMEVTRMLVALPGPYSPLIVDPPAPRRSVRAVSTEYAPID